ncbi:MAG: hypothetical protein O3A93_03035, partial [Chloroflexi bacterium]|nr:hypothetical protein [Chloroflexota bacterium]
MNTKIGKSFGLALLMAIGVVVTMLAMGMFSPGKASADHNTDSTNVHLVTFTPGSFSVNAKTSWDVTFGVSSALTAGVGTVSITFPEGVVLPSTIDKTRVAAGGGTDIFPLTTDPTVSGSTVTLTVPATNASGGALTGGTDIGAGETVTVAFSQLAGLVNPAKSGDAGSIALGTAGKVKTSAQTTLANIKGSAVVITTTISLSATSASEGDTVVATVGGFTPGLTVSLSGQLSGSAIVGSDRKATINGTMKTTGSTVKATDTANITAEKTGTPITLKATLTATASGKAQDVIVLQGRNFTFTAGTTIANVAAIDFAGVDINTGVITGSNVVTTLPYAFLNNDKDADGVDDDFTISIRIPSGATKGINQIKVTDSAGKSATATVDVEGRTVTISPTEGPPGTVIVVGGSGFPTSIAADDANTITISPTFSGAATTVKSLITGGAGDLPGADQYTIPASATATTVTVTVSIKGTGGDNLQTTGSAKFTVTTRALTVSPTSGPRGTKILVSGDKFTSNGKILADKITVDGKATTHAQVDLTSSGGLPGTEVTVPATAGLGSKTVSIADNASPALTGTAKFTVTQPTIALSPISATMGEIVTVTGDGWVPSSAVTITVSAGGGTKVATANGVGHFETGVELSSVIGVGLKVITFSAADGSTLGNTATAQSLTVPAPKITLSATTATVGSIVSVDASGFVPSSGLSKLEIGGADVREGVHTTNSAGSLTVSFKVPGLTGSQLVTVKIGSTEVSTSITVKKPTAPAPSDTTPTADVFADVIANDNLIRVFRFDNSTQTWAFF